MPKAIGLAPYLLTVHKLGAKTSDHLKVGDVDDTKTDLVQELFDYLKAHQTKAFKSATPATSSYMKVGTLNEEGTGTNRVIHCVTRAGDYGDTFQIVNVDNDKVMHDQKRNEAPLVTLYTRFEIVLHGRGVLMTTERMGLRGIKSAFWIGFSEAMTEKYPDYRVRLERVSPAKVLQQYVDEGEVKAIEARRYPKPKEVAQFSDAEDLGVIKTVWTAKRKKHLKKSAIVDAMADPKKRNELVGFLTGSDSDADLRVVLQVGDRNRTVRYDRGSSDPDGVPVFDITDQVAEAIKSGSTPEAAVRAEAATLAADLVKQGLD